MAEGKTYGGVVLRAQHQYSLADKASPKCSSSLPCCFYCSEAFCYQRSAGALHMWQDMFSDQEVPSSLSDISNFCMAV